ncbi:MAG: ABC transporter ATP-binding protein, partial [Candidatus Kariarchaeaceae archaeon]
NKSILDNLTLDFVPHKINCLLGRSGAGKTSILRLIAGISNPHSGSIYFDNIKGEDVPIDERKIGWVPQQQILFPGMNVKQNILYGMNVRQYSLEEKSKRLEELTEIVALENIIDRDVAQLSGGEKQRVALARAMAPYPNILLLDEPFSSLDAPERDRLAFTFRQIQMETEITTIHVTHSPREAEIISDEAFILSGGKILQNGPMKDLIQTPNSIEVGKILNLANIFPPNNEFGNKSAIMIPVNGIELGIGSNSAKVISVTNSLIYLLTTAGSRIQVENDEYKYETGQIVNFQINNEHVIKLADINNQRDQ